MPPQSKRGECPLQWWCDIRRNLGLSGSSFPLQLGVLHRILFPERLALSKKWHDPGVDVTMTMQIIKAYFDRTKMRAIPGKIDYYFSPQKNDVDEEDGDEDRDEDWDEDGDEDDDDNFDDNFNGNFDEEDVEHMINAGLFPFEEEDEGEHELLEEENEGEQELLEEENEEEEEDLSSDSFY
jgi:hypothetical protein